MQNDISSEVNGDTEHSENCCNINLNSCSEDRNCCAFTQKTQAVRFSFFYPHGISLHFILAIDVEH